jgi:transposase
VNHLNGKNLLPDSSLTLQTLKKAKQSWLIAATAPEAAACPDCGVLSRARHSSYWRRLKDLPIQGRSVQLKLQVGRWRCRNPVCQRKIFCQRLSAVTGKYSQETKRFEEVAQMIGHALGGRAGERLSGRLGLRISDNTLLRRVKQAAQFRPRSKRIPALGVDDWAWRKGYRRYGTILVDLKRRKVVDLLPECTASAVEQWLRQHPGVKIISRDRQGSLAYGGRRGAPAARQVADRFHLIQNLQQAVHTELACQRAHLKIPAEEFTRQTETDQAPKTVQNISRPRRTWANPSQKEVGRQRWQHKVELFQMVKSLRAQGAKVIAIMRQAGISRGLADKWLGLEECPPRAKRTSRPGMAEDFREELWRQWEQGHQEGRQLFSEIRQLGYIGSYASLMRFLTPWREQGAVGKAPQQRETNHPGAVRHVSPRVAVALLSKPKPQLNGKQSEMVEILKLRCPNFAAMRHLVLSFRGILCNGKVSSLRKWMRKAEEAGIGVIRAFVHQLKRDMAAVENAVEQVWSNGPVEGHINRLKNLKRQMYGQAKFELLRARTLPLAA